jgi:hypothetical protein
MHKTKETKEREAAGKRMSNLNNAKNIARLTQLKDQQIAKLDTFMREIKKTLSKNNAVAISGVAKSHKLPSCTGKAVIELGYIKNNSTNRRAPNYAWVHKNDLSIDDAELVYEKIHEFDREQKGAPAKAVNSIHQKEENKLDEFAKTEKLIAVKDLKKKETNDKKDLKIIVSKMYAHLGDFEMAYDILVTIVDEDFIKRHKLKVRS